MTLGGAPSHVVRASLLTWEEAKQGRMVIGGGGAMLSHKSTYKVRGHPSPDLSVQFAEGYLEHKPLPESRPPASAPLANPGFDFPRQRWLIQEHSMGKRGRDGKMQRG